MMRPFRSPTYHAILAGYGLGAVALYAGLSETGQPQLVTPLIAFLLPTAGALTDVLLRGLCVRHPVAGATSRAVLATYDSIMLRLMVFIMGMHAVILLGALGLLRDSAWTPQLVPVMLGLTLISVGNLLPRTRPNLAIGIRTERTLSNRALWMRIHRSAGYMVVALGAVILVSAIAVPAPFGPRMVVLVFPAAVLGIGRLVRDSRKHTDP